MDTISPKSATSALFSHNFSICITYGVWVWLGHGVIYWELPLCKSSSVRRNYGTLSLSLENNSGQTCTIKTVFNILNQAKALRISHCESVFTNTTGGPSGLVLPQQCLPLIKLHWSHATGKLLSPFPPSQSASCRGWESPLVFFSFRYNKPSSLFSVVCISLYFIHVLWCIEVVWNSWFPCGKWLWCCHGIWDTDDWCYFGL